MTFRPVSILICPAFRLGFWVALSFSSGSQMAWGADVLLNNYLVNASFETPVLPGTPPVTCPDSWNCTGSPSPGFGVYTVTSAQYTPGVDGLPNPKIVPFGAQAAFSPTTIEGSGDLYQMIPHLFYEAGNTYKIQFWIGLPNMEPGGAACQIPNVSCQVTDFPNPVNFNFTAGPTIAAEGIPDPFPISSPSQGKWMLVTKSFNAEAGSGYIGKQVGVDFHVVATHNNQAVNLDIPQETPEPALHLVGGMLFVLGLWRFRRRQKLAAAKAR